MAAEMNAPATTPPRAQVTTLGATGGGGHAGHAGQSGHLKARRTANSSRDLMKSRACWAVTMTPEHGAGCPESMGAAWVHGEPSRAMSTAVIT